MQNETQGCMRGISCTEHLSGLGCGAGQAIIQKGLQADNIGKYSGFYNLRFRACV